jgi:hypothetical protein
MWSFDFFFFFKKKKEKALNCRKVPTAAAAFGGSIRAGRSVAAGGRWSSLRLPKLGSSLRSRRPHGKKTLQQFSKLLFCFSTPFI